MLRLYRPDVDTASSAAEDQAHVLEQDGLDLESLTPRQRAQVKDALHARLNEPGQIEYDSLTGCWASA